MKRACRNCTHWKPGPTMNLAGECRREAPVVLMFSDRPESHWPSVNADDWCGQIALPPRCSGQYQTPEGVAMCHRAVGHKGNCGEED